MKNKGQGALEYLLLFGGAVLIAAVVITLLFNFTSLSISRSNCTDIFYLDKYSWEKPEAEIVNINNRTYCRFGDLSSSVTLKEIIKIDGKWKNASDYIKTDNGYISKEEIRNVLG